jgi:hypothetical protein
VQGRPLRHRRVARVASAGIGVIAPIQPGSAPMPRSGRPHRRTCRQPARGPLTRPHRSSHGAIPQGRRAASLELPDRDVGSLLRGVAVAHLGFRGALRHRGGADPHCGA